MTEKTKPEVNLSNDVQVIRTILFGEHFERIQKQFEALENELAALRQENQTLWTALKSQSEQQFQELAARLEQEKSERLETSQTLRKDFDAEMKEMSKRLLTHEEQQGGLLTSLAEALTKAR